MPVYLSFSLDHPRLSAGLDARELKLLAEDLREVVERDIHLDGVLALALSGLALAVAFALFAAVHGVAGLALALPDAPLLLVAEAKLRHVDLRDGDADGVFALPPEELALGDVPPEVVADLAPYDVSESRVILVDLESHRVSSHTRRDRRPRRASRTTITTETGTPNAPPRSAPSSSAYGRTVVRSHSSTG
jgi:hypothetical protein